MPSLRTANFETLITLPRDNYWAKDWSIMTDGEDTVWISQQKIGCNRTDYIEIPRRIFNRLIDAYQKDRKPIRRKSK